MGLFDAISGLNTGSVGNNMDNNEDDVLNVKRNLNKAGYFDDLDQEPEPHGFITNNMEKGIRSYQKDKGLKVDGILHPRGETERGLFHTITGQILEPPIDEDSGGKVGFGGNITGTFMPMETRKEKRETKPFSLINPDTMLSLNDKQDTEAQHPLPPKKIEHDVFASSNKETAPDTLVQYDATGRMIRSASEDSLKTGGLPQRNSTSFETTKPSFDVGTAPVINDREIRQKILLSNEPAKFEIKDNPDLQKNPSVIEKLKQTFIKNEGFGSKVVKEHEKDIDELSKKHGVDADLVKSVMWVENARGHYGGLNNLADYVGVSDSQAPMNINGKIWGELIDKPGEKLNNGKDNIEAGVILLKRIGDRIENPTPEKIGSIWNYAGRENVNEIGKEIGQAYKSKPWEKKE